MSRRLMVYFAILFLSMICACASVEVGKKFDTSAVNQIEVGKTTESQVIAILGEPLKKTINTDGTKKYGYAHITSKAHALPFTTKATASGEKLVLTFDKNGIVTSMDSGIVP